ncbi:helix-turn-helix domain-containing protein [Streptomyces sp. NPDC050738]|uniref:helix-turn-helix domain-containing protein n=1 Tax=Streptomyces sp. NPDC050738 TaxID=3154744 RepID=UPI00343A2A9A
MSDTATPTRTLQAVPDPAPKPLAGLSDTPATIYTELATTPGATAAELALATGLGRSTASKALTLLEEHGLAHRTPGEKTKGRRTPDRWTATPVPTPEEAVPPADGSHASDPKPKPEPEAVTAEAAPQGDIPHAQEPDPVPAEVMTASDTTPAITATTPDVASAPPAAPAPGAVGGTKVRLAPGGLRQLVIAHLTAHPDEAFTATGISRRIEKSSGAIANALVTLTGQGIAEQVSERPRTYQLAPSALEPGQK